MKAIRIQKCGGPEVVQTEDIPRPKPGPDEAIVEVHAASLNHLDIWVRRGMPKPPLPHTMGSDGAGVVVELGELAAREAAGGRFPKIGDEVLIDPGLSCGRCDTCFAGEQSQCPSFRLLGEAVSGTLAEFVAVPARNCHPKPKHFSWPQAAAFGLVHLTAWRMLITRAKLRAGETVLINGIGGGVATAALGIARVSGAQTIVTSSSDAKLARARQLLGATAGVHYRIAGKDLAKAVKEANGGRPVDLVVDSVGGEAYSQSLQALRKGGRLVTCGATIGGTPPNDIHRIFWNQLTILGSTMGTPAEMRAVLGLAEAGAIAPLIDQMFPLDKAKEAIARLEAGEQFGKVVVEVKL
jgi:NADPH:quinone reductase-like Zn-dependent oxidoreductase